MAIEAKKAAATIRMTLEAILDAAEVAGEWGAPSGVLYAGLMTMGCTLDQYQQMMDVLVEMGCLRQDGDRYIFIKKLS